MEAKIEQIEDFKARNRLFGQHGKGYDKSLDVVTFPIVSRVWFVVSDHKVEVYTGPSLVEAIYLYNKIV